MLSMDSNSSEKVEQVYRVALCVAGNFYQLCFSLLCETNDGIIIKQSIDHDERPWKTIALLFVTGCPFMTWEQKEFH